ncbi:MAG: hypothetical protein AAF541_03335 [Pseudomonadota bacterium]
MFDITVNGDTPTAWAFIRACNLHGTAHCSNPQVNAQHPTGRAGVLTPNLTKVVQALGLNEALTEIAHQPDRAQVRFGRSAYLLSELPLGKFCADRYNAPLLNLQEDQFIEILRTNQASRESKPGINLQLDTLPGCSSTAPPSSPPETNPRYSVGVFVSEQIASTANANITWLNEGATIWQFSTPDKTYFYICNWRPERPLDIDDWHNSLHPAITGAKTLDEPTPITQQPSDNWYQGHVAYAGLAAYSTPSFWREHCWLGLEDAWVLSRMLENYEEDWSDAYAEYEKYRGARGRRVARNLAISWEQITRSNPIGKLTRNLNIALGTRFLPEIAMQKLDWQYGHDCIRGFR